MFCCHRWHLHQLKATDIQGSASCVGSSGRGWGWDADQVYENNKNPSNFQGRIPRRLLHLHLTSLGATISFPTELQEESERKCMWGCPHRFVKASLGLRRKEPTTNPILLLMPCGITFLPNSQQNHWQKDQSVKLTQGMTWLNSGSTHPSSLSPLVAALEITLKPSNTLKFFLFFNYNNSRKPRELPLFNCTSH